MEIYKPFPGTIQIFKIKLESSQLRLQITWIRAKGNKKQIRLVKSRSVGFSAVCEVLEVEEEVEEEAEKGEERTIKSMNIHLNRRTCCPRSFLPVAEYII